MAIKVSGRIHCQRWRIMSVIFSCKNSKNKWKSYYSQKISLYWSAHAGNWVGDPYPTAQSHCPPERPPPCPQGGGALQPNISACWTPSPRLHPRASWPDGSAAGPRSPATGRRQRGCRRAPWTTGPEHTQTRSASCSVMRRTQQASTMLISWVTRGRPSHKDWLNGFCLGANIHSVPLWLINIFNQMYLCSNTLSIFNLRLRFRHNSFLFLHPCIKKGILSYFLVMLAQVKIKWRLKNKDHGSLINKKSYFSRLCCKCFKDCYGLSLITL